MMNPTTVCPKPKREERGKSSRENVFPIEAKIVSFVSSTKKPFVLNPIKKITDATSNEEINDFVFLET